MGELRLHALSITEVRDMFGAAPTLAATLRQLAGERFRVAPTTRHERGLLGRLGPLLKRTPAESPVFPDHMPLPTDWENLIAGRHVAPDRVDISWQVLDLWIDSRDWGTFTAQFSPTELDGFDFALTSAGLPSRNGLRKLMADDVQLGIRPGSGMRVGYSKNAHVLATLDALAGVVEQVDGQHREVAQRLYEYLADFPRWTNEAREQGRPEPDLVTVWWERNRTH